ncbi:ABC transporter ATP-binding protein [Bradyrhizobium neotropicale]|uniref:ABC transporter ATP-binding protein n=1 Tax=Bradyrhizobium neotropicale TaxID=1497615 RepID=UPI001AD6EC72|nr:ABC transporter ATP-binding protein [Bradyrhizobium neotropicale]MBO4221767.1 ATP-binding cassette domain-containing protein [Bradyrhizobium neotropicale]
MAQIRIEYLRKSFDQFTAVEGSTFTIDDGTFFALLGPSGCGKTTTLRMIAGLELPTEGKILLDGEDVTFHRAAARDIAFVFQLFALYPHMNVGQNIGFPLKCQGMARQEIRERVQETARMLRIEHLLSSKTSKLSAGDRQRVALGRAMVRRPKAFLMDEPLGALDAEFRHLMCGELRDLHDRIKATTVYVTHDQLEAMSMADQIAIMNKGRVEQIGTPQEVYDRPACMFVADFIGSPSMNFLHFEGGLRSGDRAINFHDTRLAVPEIREDRASAALALGVRPEHIRFADAGSVRGEVFGAEYLGTTQIVTIDTAYGRVAARLPSSASVRIGETVGLEFNSDRLSLFDAGSGLAIRTAREEGMRHG